MQKEHIIPLKSKCYQRPKLSHACVLSELTVLKKCPFGVWYKIWLHNKISFIYHIFIVLTNLVSVRAEKCRGKPPAKFSSKWFIFCDHVFLPWSRPYSHCCWKKSSFLERDDTSHFADPEELLFWCRSGCHSHFPSGGRLGRQRVITCLGRGCWAPWPRKD